LLRVMLLSLAEPGFGHSRTISLGGVASKLK
jgi:hypothetical protein